ncbi:HK97 family phage prohead protease [uncultured Clostridium sp.]|uniref:HK97 family phage prohead protease n=1 Tax=uncultured Clostridium sp. TaxID=59620 RepID=UPI0025F934E8|nr:HK97 family phage prohead protease [uncultured Clostridium sp.]
MRIIEYRAVNEVRTVEDEKAMIIEGVVNNIGQWSKPIGGKFREKINEGVFERAINRALENGDIFFLHQHDNRALPLASIKSNTLELVEDKENNVLKMRAILPDTSFSRDVYELVKSGVLREFSFGFNKPKSKWNIGKDGMKERSLVDFNIYEISIVRVGAYNETQAYVREYIKDSIYIYNKNRIKIIKEK